MNREPRYAAAAGGRRIARAAAVIRVSWCTCVFCTRRIDTQAFGHPSMTKSFDEKLEFLRSQGAADLAHSGHTFMDHLLGTRALLVHWEAGPDICDAGLFHAVYGTEIFGKAIVDQSHRVIVRELIGEKAERLAWLFCCMRRERFVLEASHGAPDHICNRATGEPVPIMPDEVSALANLVVANRLERLPRVRFPWQRGKPAKSLLPLRRHILPGAFAALAAYRNAESVWRGLAVVLAMGAVVLLWFAISMTRIF